MSDIQHDLAADVRRGTPLLPAGIAAMVVAALASVAWASPATPDSASGDSTCRISVVGDQWIGHGCVDRAADAAR